MKVTLTRIKHNTILIMKINKNLINKRGSTHPNLFWTHTLSQTKLMHTNIKQYANI